MQPASSDLGRHFKVHSIAMSQKDDVPESVKRFSQKNMDKLRESEDKQRRLRENVGKTRKFTRDEQSALNIDSKEAFEDFLRAALDAKVVFDKEHEHGAGRLSKGATSLAASAYDILQDFSPMVDIVKDCGAPYGSMAVGTFCFLFAVANNRGRMEDQIKSTFLDIHDRLPGVSMYQHIYNENDELDQLLQSKIVDAYHSFIAFCIAALDFYTCGGFRRMIRALKSHGSLDEQASCVQKAVVDVRLVSEELLSKNVNAVKVNLEEVKTLNIEQQRTIEGQSDPYRLDKSSAAANLNSRGDLKHQITGLQSDRDFDNLEKIRELLGLEAFSHEAHLAQLNSHRRSVAAEFQRKNWYSEKTPDEQLCAVVSDPAYKEWLGSPHSRVLVLSGENYVIGASHCWVSPVALDLIAKLMSGTTPDPDPCVFYLLGLREVDDTCPHVLTFLILRLLSLNKEALRNEVQFAELWADLQSYARVAESSDAPAHDVQRTLEKIALRALNMFDAGKTVWIVLDRVDKCRAAPGPRGKSNRRGGRTLLETLVHLVERATARVKVLGVVNRADWHVEEQADELGEEQEGNVVIRTFSQSEGLIEDV
ncbi:hypothetical protein DL765_010351 [Monosporascus sp. GIB2]|nr:hypothetical protein DL765_010351 [Monosporascus sp. GIB2]